MEGTSIYALNNAIKDHIHVVTTIEIKTCQEYKILKEYSLYLEKKGEENLLQN